jgi:tetratricopeptide (TPR) repeat protein
MAVSGRMQVDWTKHQASSAERLIKAGRYGEAIAELDTQLADAPQSCKLLRFKHIALMGLRRFAEAAEVISKALELQPENRLYRKLYAIALKDSGEFTAALSLLEPLHAEDEYDIQILGALAVACFRCGDQSAAVRLGQKKLDALSAQAAPVAVDAAEPRTPASGRNIVSYSLWGSAPQYCEGALHNARQVPELLPGWTARFYLGPEVSEPVVRGLADLGAELITEGVSDVPPMLRRFLVHDDPAVERYIVRDSDSRIGPRELAAVDEWLSSGCGFHAMRDHPFHSELMMGGMWGGTARRTFQMASQIEHFSARHGADHSYGADQFFLARYVWPRIYGDVLVHDSYYHTHGSRPFPDGSRGTDANHIGAGLVLERKRSDRRLS